MTHLPAAYSPPVHKTSTIMQLSAKGAGLAALLSSGAIFGFFYAWVCSTMWGLDATDPRIAIEAMQAMNASVRNATFAPAFFGTPIVMALASLLAWKANRLPSALAFAIGSAIYFGGGMVLTMSVNVPMNEALGALTVPADLQDAKTIWTEYSSKWQVYNVIRTVFSGIALSLAGIGLLKL